MADVGETAQRAPSPVVAVAVTPAADAPPPPGDEPPAATCDPALQADGCFPSKEYSDAACSDPVMALGMFRRGTSWVRAYVTRNLESWDPARRSRVARSHLAFDEEVLVLHPFKPAGGVMVIGAATARGWTSVSAIRADGSCVSLMADEIAMQRPPSPNHPSLAWEKLSDPERATLLVTPDLKRRAEQMTRACVVVNDKRCAQARAQLTDALLATSAATSAPKAAPTWSSRPGAGEPATASNTADSR